jgi:uncharacterized damage-inducible protein DinB
VDRLIAAGAQCSTVSESEQKQTLRRYLQEARDALLWKLEGLSDYDIRRPMTPTGTNLLGLVKHCAASEFVYFGRLPGRRFADEADLDWHEGDETELSGHMYATESESREQVTDFYRRACAHSDATIEELPPDARVTVPWWPEGLREPTMSTLLVHMIQETARHTGHADIIRESIDGAAGEREGVGDPAAEHAATAWKQHYAKLEDIARRSGNEADPPAMRSPLQFPASPRHISIAPQP